MDQKERELRLALKNDFAFYAPRCLKIRTKAGAIKPLCLNAAQRYLHARAERQRQQRGYVRIIVVKGRQQGISTYIEGRYYWLVTHNYGVRSFILTHEQAATDTLFEMVQRYHEHCPPLVRPSVGNNNDKELYFDKLDSGYKIGTAGTKGTGRSMCLQLFHGSEKAYWKDASIHSAGIMQAIPLGEGTEVFLESTGNGVGDEFHNDCLTAEVGESDYELVFIPWYWQEEYRLPVPEGFELDEEDEEYQRLYNLDLEQMAWRRFKITELKDPTLFKQEYPATLQEAFQSGTIESFISGEVVTAAQKTIVTGSGPKVLGVDVARMGKDRTAIAFRQGRVVHWVRFWQKLKGPEVIGRVKMAIEEVRPDRVFIDVDGVGGPILDELELMFPEEMLAGVHANGTAFNSDRYPNRRNEMWHELKDWLEDGPVHIPDMPELATDICAPGFDYDSKGRKLVESKKGGVGRGKAQTRMVRSPDLADAVCLTFAAPVAPKRPPPPITYIPIADTVMGY